MSSPPHNPAATERSAPTSERPAEQEFSRSERLVLLRLAHTAIESEFHDWTDPTHPHLLEPRGVFTTLYLHGQLRGCVGYVFPVTPLWEAAVQTARAAASQDNRFRPVTREEAPALEISLSVLSHLYPLEPEQVEVGRHGLLVSQEGRRGVLLPQVPVEHHWDRTTFLEQTCRKAGLPDDAWQKGANLEGFTAEVFGDSDTR